MFLQEKEMTEPRDDTGFERLADWVEGRLTQEEAETVAQSVARGGEKTRRDAEWLRAFMGASEDAVLSPPPPEVRGELMRRFEAYAEERRGPGFLERLVAGLTFDSGLQPAFGVRSAGARERQMIYSTDLADVAVNVRPRAGGNLDVLGQLLPIGDVTPEGFAVQLLRSDGTEAGIAAVDEFGEFAFEDVPPGEYGVVLGDARAEILIPSVQLSR